MITEEILEKLKEIEGNIEAYERGHYDTHDLDSIEENIEEYRSEIEQYKQFLPTQDYGFWAYIFKDGALVLDTEKVFLK